MLASNLDCSTAALPSPQKVSCNYKLVELKMLNFRDRLKTGISILTSAADKMLGYIAHPENITPFRLTWPSG